MNNYGQFGPLLGTIFIGNSYCKFLVYAANNAEVLTFHEVPLVQIVSNPGWIEFDPVDIWKCVVECIKIGTKNLIILDINPANIIAIGITNQRETTVLWHKTDGMPLCNAIAWNDTRTSSTLNTILAKIRNRKNYLKPICGLPLSNCFSALKIKWIMDNVSDVKQQMRNNNCMFGTLDTWILWNLTGGIEDGIHVTDVTNASRTMLMNLETLQWDHKMCSFFRIPMNILPKIKSCSEIYGLVHDGPLQGIPIAGCIGEQPAALLGQMCTKTSQAACTYDDGCFLLINTGQEIIDSENGLLATVAFQLGANEKPVYALEGAFANAGYAIQWLKDNLSLNAEITQNLNATAAVKSYCGDSSVLSSCNSNSSIYNQTNNVNGGIGNQQQLTTDVVFVPAFSGLHAPYWKHNASGLMLGLNNRTTARDVTIACYEAICYQTRDLLESFGKDLTTWKHLSKLTIGGEFSENQFFLQLLADLCGITVERPQTSSPSCLGAMLAAGITMNVINLDNARSMFAPPSDICQATMCSNQRDLKYRRWKFAIKKCLNWDIGDYNYSTKYDMDYEDKDPQLAVRCSIPGGIFLISSFALYLVTTFLRQNKIH